MTPYEYLFFSPEIEGWNGPGWYFWEETWTSIYGPYETIDEAKETCRKYAEEL